MQVVGVGAQDDFGFAQEFIDTFGTETPTMLWDPTGATWITIGVTRNSQMAVMAPDLSGGTQLFSGFDKNVETQILDVLKDFPAS